MQRDGEDPQRARGTVPAAVAERLRALGEEIDAIDLKEEDQEDYNTGSTLGALIHTEEWTRAVEVWQSALKCVTRPRLPLQSGLIYSLSVAIAKASQS